jgi:hypothetical protein
VDAFNQETIMPDRNYTAAGAAQDWRNPRRISWGAIIAGTVAALSVQFLLTLLGVSIGLWTLPAAGPEFLQEMGIGAAIWALLSFVIALYCGGWIAGRMSGLRSKLDGLLEGFLVWGVVTVVTFMLLTTAVGGLIGGAAGMAGEAMTLAVEQVEDPMATVEEFGQPAREALEEFEVEEEEIEAVATASAAAAFGAFLSLLLGAVAASFAGRQGSISSLREAQSAVTPPKADVKE